MIKEDLPGVLPNMYLQAKDMILENTGVDVLKTSSFCNFLKEFYFLAKFCYNVNMSETSI